MSMEFDAAPEGDTGDDPTAGANAGETTEGAAPATPATPAAPAAEAPKPEKTFTQAEVDAMMRERLSRPSLERQFRERGWVPKTEFERAAEQPATGTPSDPLALHVAKLDLNYRLSEMRQRYPDFAENEVEILEVAADLGVNRDDLLEIAYKLHKYPQLTSIDIKKIEKEAGERAVKEYVSKKETQATTTPSPEGPGGTAPTARPRDVKTMSWDEVDEAAAKTVKTGRAAA